MQRPDTILTADAMRAAERAVIDAGIPEYELMERAGAACAEIVWRVGGRRDTLVLCGPGNNGGDGYVIAQLLAQRGVPVRIAALGDPKTESAKRARSLWTGPVEPFADAGPAAQVVDALFGTGLTRGLEGDLAHRLTELVDGAQRSFAIDLPSGLHTDSGECLSLVPQFDIGIALGAWKPAHWLQPGAATMRQTIIADIGVEPAEYPVRLLGAPHLAAPGPGAHKYNRGLVVVVGGAMPGASRLSAAAALRGGAGSVRHWGAGDIPPVLDAIVNRKGDVQDTLGDRRVSAVLIGPGLGRDQEAERLLDATLMAGHPIVADADALHLLAGRLERLPDRAILTPHEGEFVTLFGRGEGSKIDRARAAAKRSGAVVIYKGHDTVIAAPDGRARIAPPASGWLASAGTGDVLAGIAVARLAVTGDPFQAACEAVWLHGEAARFAGPGLVADDLPQRLPQAIARAL